MTLPFCLGTLTFVMMQDVSTPEQHYQDLVRTCGSSFTQYYSRASACPGWIPIQCHGVAITLIRLWTPLQRGDEESPESCTSTHGDEAADFDRVDTGLLRVIPDEKDEP